MGDLSPEALEVVERFDSCADMRNQLRKLAGRAAEWAGLPMAFEGGPRIKVHPSYSYASIFNDKPDPDAKSAAVEGRKYRSEFYSTYKRSDIVIWHEPNGKINWGYHCRYHSLGFQLNTLDACAAWGIEQEHNALTLLGSMISHHKFRSYILTGSFIERSKRSGVWYMFRKLRPTVAMSTRQKDNSEGEMRILASMCMHPIGYYEDSWAGAMCPTDDVVAHLSMMRGDEHLFWKRSTQHPAHSPNAGL